MQMILQSNRWDCLPTSFAICLDILPTEIFEVLGHDGSSILWPNLEEPYCRQSFHIEEMIDFCLGLLYNPVLITRNPYHAPLVQLMKYQSMAEPSDLMVCHPFGDESEARFIRYLSKRDAVLLGNTVKEDKPHAVAWSYKDQLVFDPTGFKYPLNEFDAHSAYLIF